MLLCLFATGLLAAFIVTTYRFADVKPIEVPCKLETPQAIVVLGKSLFRQNLTLGGIDALVDVQEQKWCLPRAKTVSAHQLNQNHENLVIIVPYRNRSLDLLNFLLYMTPYLRRRSGVHYEILVVEQYGGDRPFNRAKLFNVAVKELYHATATAAVEAQNLSSENITDRLGRNINCFALHDIDKLPMHPDTRYECLQLPHQLLRMTVYKNGRVNRLV